MNSASNVSTLLPLYGVRVVSIALNLPGPACVRRLSDFGASVIKVEPPDSLGGDPLRTYAASYYKSLHAGLDVRTLNLKDVGQRAAFDDLLANADVFITAQRESALARLQLAGDVLSFRSGFAGSVIASSSQTTTTNHVLLQCSPYRSRPRARICLGLSSTTASGAYHKASPDRIWR